ncbi:centriolar coiled coil protein 110kDa isoform X2 [Arctopsyche grandis]|uniref:centriolar coiled coil protein 110kDa isoform X2 n=1 Tax=Arctopsyche grandis TaxID=121162 RepID=UPI00406DA23C
MSESKDGSSSYGGSYVSCMKLNGVPLLPPLMTPECRQEMQYYKQLAMAVERRISDLKFCLDETTMNSNVLQSDSEEWFDGVNISIVSSKSDYYNESHDYPKYEYSNTTYGTKPVFVDNNDFESMNSQLTVIDNNDESPTEGGTDTPVNEKVDGASVKSSDAQTDSQSISIEMYQEKSSYADESQSKCDGSNLKRSARNQPLKESSKDNLINNSKQTLHEHSKFANNFVIKNDSTKSIYGVPKNDSSSSKNSSKLASVTKSTKNIKNNATKKDNASLPKVATSFVSKKSTFLDGKDLLNLKKIPRKSSTLVNKTKLSPSKNVTGSLNNISSGLSSPPKLVRQNSYTLEYPSPLLLAHLEVQSLVSGVELHSISMSESTSTSHLNKQKSLDSNKAKEIWSSVGSDINSLSLNENSAVPSISNKDNSDLSDKRLSTLGCENKLELKYDKQPTTKPSTLQSLTTSKTSSLNISSDEKAKEVDKVSESSPHIESPVSDKTNSTVMSNTETNDAATSLPLDVSKCSSTSSSSNVCLKYILKKFEEDHEKKLVELINKQKEEQLLLQKTFENQQKLLLAKFQSTSKSSIDSNIINDRISNVENLKTSKDCNATFIRQSTEPTHVSKEMPNIYNGEDHSAKIQNEDEVDRYLKINEAVLLKSRNLRSQKPGTETLTKTNMESRDAPRYISSSKLTEVQFRRSGDVGLDCRNGDGMRSQMSEAQSLDSVNDRNDDENLHTARSANTLDDLNFTFASDDASSGSDVKTNVSIPSMAIRDFDGMSKLKSAFDKITKIQQNLASQPAYRYPQNRNYQQDDYDRQTVSLSSIGTLSQVYSEPENHYSIADRNLLSLNLIDVNRPHGGKHSLNRISERFQKITEKEIRAATTIVAYAKGFLTRRLMRTEKVESIVQTVRDTLLCALQLHRDENGIQGADVDLHRRLLQQITAACYALHDTFIIYSPCERMSIIAQDRDRKISLSHRSSSSVSSVRQLSATTQKILKRKLEGMSKSHSGVFTNRSHRHLSSNPMTRSHYGIVLSK